MDHEIRLSARKAFCASIAVGKGQKPPHGCHGDCFRCEVTEPMRALEAALTAVLPMIRAEVLEEAAKVADDMGREEQTNTRDVDALTQACAREEMGYEIATAIRALKGGKGWQPDQWLGFAKVD